MTFNNVYVRQLIQLSFEFINLEFKGLFSLRLEIVLSATITFLIYGFELMKGMQNYKSHKMDIYRGIFENVPPAANFTPNSIVSKSVHYSGFLVGYMAWGFIITFHLIFFILTLFRFIFLRMRYVELVLAVIVPVTVIYLLNMVCASSAGRFFFMRGMDDKINLNNRKTYAIFIYFTFFAGKN